MHDMQLALNNSTETREINVFHKTSADMGMVHCVSETTSSYLEQSNL